MTDEERMQRESSLIATIRRKLPDFVKACADDTELELLHQGSFAADYQEHEYMLLGMAIKYAGLRGKEVRVIGKSRANSRSRHNPVTAFVETGTRKMRKEFKVKLNGEESRSATQHARKIVRIGTPSDDMQQEYTPLP